MTKYIFFTLLLCSIAFAQNYTLSPNMSLPVPTVGSESGPNYANDINNSLNIIDGHNHTAGSGVQVPTAGLNINSDLTFGNNSATNLKSSIYTAQSSFATNQSIYVKGVDLYYNDGNGNTIRMTAGGSIAGTSGSISGLTSPASASYNAGSGTFIWQQNTNQAANLDAASVIFRKTTASSNGITVSPPSSISSNYNIFWPSLPGSNSFLTIDNSGNMGTTLTSALANSVGSTMTSTGANAIGSTMTSTGANAIGQSMTSTGADSIAQNIVRTTGSSVGVLGVAQAGGGTFSTSSTSYVDVTGLSVTITTHGNPVSIDVGGCSDGNFTYWLLTTPGTGAADMAVLKGASIIQQWNLQNNNTIQIPLSNHFIDTTVAGSPSTYTYKTQIKMESGATSTQLTHACITAYEL